MKAAAFIFRSVVVALVASIGLSGCSDDPKLPTAAEEEAMEAENAQQAAKRGWIDVKPIDPTSPVGSEETSSSGGNGDLSDSSPSPGDAAVHD